MSVRDATNECGCGGGGGKQKSTRGQFVRFCWPVKIKNWSYPLAARPVYLLLILEASGTPRTSHAKFLQTEIRDSTCDFFPSHHVNHLPKLRYAFHALRCPSGCQGAALIVRDGNDTAAPRPTKLKNPSIVLAHLLGTFTLDDGS